MSRLYFLCPDFPAPSGGTRTIYWYVHQLRRAGFDAAVVHEQADFRLDWHGLDVPILGLAGGVDLKPDDVVVIPEGGTNFLRSMQKQPAIKVMLALQWAPDYYSTLEPGEHWGELGAQAILTPSQAIARYLDWLMPGLPITIIPGYINQTRYYYEPTRKRPLISYMPRKSRHQGFVRAALERDSGEIAQFDWLELAHFSEAEFAQYLRESRVYLTPSSAEGLNISVLEAMACGCVVVGYSGVGGNEFLIAEGESQNYVSVENGNLPELGVTVRKVLETLALDPRAYDAVLENAITTAARYQDETKELQALTEFFSRMTRTSISNSDSPPVLTSVQNSPEGFGQQRSPQPKPSPAKSSAESKRRSQAAADLAYKAGQLKKQGNLDAALVAFRQALAEDDTIPELWFNTGNLLQALKQREQAEEAYRRAIALRSEFYPAHLNLANSLRDRGAKEAAIGHYQTVIEVQSDCTLAYRNLGQMLVGMKRGQEAIAVFQSWAKQDPENLGALNGIGIALQADGQLDQALRAFERAYAVDNQRFDTVNNLGALLRMMRRPHEAVPYLQKAIELDPDSDTAVSNLAHSLLNLGRTSEAIASVEGLLKRQPDSPTGHFMRGYALVLQARAKEALDCFEECWHLDTSATSAITNALFGLLYRDDLSASEITEQLRHWANRLPQPATPLSHENHDFTPDRRLNIGFLSADLRSHPVAFFLEPILTHYNRDSLHITCYHTAAGEDPTTERLKAQVSRWRSCVGFGDEQLARQIQADNIDILIDLSGHTQGNRAPVLNYRAAPLQMLYIGYPSTTGMDSVDYLISDAAVSPPEFDHLYTEKVLRVDGSFWCFRPHNFAPEPGPLPVIANGYITFGSFNNSAKLCDTTLSLWAKTLAAVPSSKLLLKALAFADEATQDYFREKLMGYGVSSERLIFEGPTLNLEEFFEAYQRVDIALDPTPYNGGTTTCEALWMGVPVVTLRGERFSARMSHSFLGNVGLSELSTGTLEEYVAVAKKLANDGDRLSHIREGLREQMAQSPICDAPRAAQDLEGILRQAWQKKFCPNLVVREKWIDQ